MPTQIAASVPRQTPGPRMVGGYALGACVGSGASARVFRARRPGGPEVALKILVGPGAASDRTSKRFRREVTAAAKLDHENLVRLLDHGVDPVAGPYLVMPLFEGQTLRRFTADRRLSPLAAALVAAPLLDGLAAIHAAGLVHRDLKPENVLLTPDGRLVIVDLGLAVQERDTRLTSDGAVVGSVPYMSPEQIEGQRVGPPSDLWSVGVMIHEWIAGLRPFARARQTEEVAAILKADHPPLTSVDRRTPPALAELVEACLQVDPGLRPRHAGELVERMDALLDWFPPGQRQAELASLVANPVGYEHGLSAVDKGRLAATARRAIQAGDGFGALKLLDRALAHGPDDPELEFLVDRATAACARAQDRVDLRAAGRAGLLRRPALWNAFFLLALTVGAGAWWGLRPLAEDGPVPASAAEAGSAWLEPIPLEDLSDTDPAFNAAGLQPGPGEPVIDPALLGGATPAAELARLNALLVARPGDPELGAKRALARMAGGEVEAGRSELDAVLASHPDHAFALSVAGYLAVRQGRFADAEGLFGRAVAADPTAAEALRNRGILRHRLGRTRQAYADLTAALVRDPDDLQALAELALLYERAGRDRQALPLLRRAAAVSPANPLVWMELADDEPDPTRALAAARRAVSLRPDSPRATRQLCHLSAARRAPDALDLCRRADRLDPGDAQVRADLERLRQPGGSLRETILAGLAPIPADALPDHRPPVPVEQVAGPDEPLVPARLFGPQGPEAALESIQAQMRTAPDDPELPVGRALALMGCGRRDEGLTALERIVAKSPELAVAWAALGYIRLRQGDLPAAEAAFTRAIELDPQRVDALRNRGILRHRLGRVRQAYQDLVAALRADPDDLQAARELANVYEKTGRRADALPLVEHIVRLGPTDPTAWLDLAVVRTDPDRRMAAIERALDLAPGLPRALRMRCTERTAQHHPQAVAACDAALRAAGEDASVRMHRGLALFHAGDDEGALADLDRAVAAGKDDADSLVNRAIVRTHAGRLASARADLTAACRMGHTGACGELAAE